MEINYLYKETKENLDNILKIKLKVGQWHKKKTNIVIRNLILFGIITCLLIIDCGYFHNLTLSSGILFILNIHLVIKIFLANSSVKKEILKSEELNPSKEQQITITEFGIEVVKDFKTTGYGWDSFKGFGFYNECLFLFENKCEVILFDKDFISKNNNIVNLFKKEINKEIIIK